MKIELKFDEQMTSAVIEGRKCCTFRRERHGNVGDTFEVAGQTYRILQVVASRMDTMLYTYYGAEGFADSDDMRDWIRRHGGNEYALGYTHFFARVPEAANEA